MVMGLTANHVQVVGDKMHEFKWVDNYDKSKVPTEEELANKKRLLEHLSDNGVLVWADVDHFSIHLHDAYKYGQSKKRDYYTELSQWAAKVREENEKFER